MIRILHTSDLHIGQRFFDYDRTEEHKYFFDWLINIIKLNNIDVLLISGDIFDTANPSSESQKLFYQFLFRMYNESESTKIILTAGNHDSPSRLTAPAALMNLLNISVIGSVEKDSEGKVNYNNLTVPVFKNGDISAVILAIPFLRQGDFPVIKDEDNFYSASIVDLYNKGIENIRDSYPNETPIILMGHLHTSGAELSDSERGVRGGLEVVNTNDFDQSISYFALGHIHKSQKISNNDKIRYSGSPIPMSFSEINYKHKVLQIDIDDNNNVAVNEILIPRHTDMIRIGTPNAPLSKEDAFIRIMETDTDKMPNAPYLEINILLDTPDLSLSQNIKDVLENKNVKFARCGVYYKNSDNKDDIEITDINQFKELTPIDLLKNHYNNKYSSEIPDEIKSIFENVVNEVMTEND